MKVDDLNKSLIDFLRLSFGGKNIECFVFEKGKEDENIITLSNAEVKEMIDGIENFEHDMNTVTGTIKQLKLKFLNVLSRKISHHNQ